MKSLPFLSFTLLFALALAWMGCDSNEAGSSQAEVVIGQEKALGNGTAQSWAELDDEGLPTAVGVSFSEQAFNSLYAAHKAAHDDEISLQLMLPSDIADLPYDHITLDWNPHGHPPEGIYTVPHFDAHFYLINDAQRDAITPADPEFGQKAAKQPDPALIPAGYFLPAPDAVPRMGTHWLHPASPELNGQPFSATFIYGFFDAQMVFAEPMFAASFLETKPDFRVAIPQPQRYEVPGYYPTEYIIRYDADEQMYTVALTGLTFRN